MNYRQLTTLCALDPLPAAPETAPLRPAPAPSPEAARAAEVTAFEHGDYTPAHPVGRIQWAFRSARLPLRCPRKLEPVVSVPEGSVLTQLIASGQIDKPCPNEANARLRLADYGRAPKKPHGGPACAALHLEFQSVFNRLTPSGQDRVWKRLVSQGAIPGALLFQDRILPESMTRGNLRDAVVIAEDEWKRRAPPVPPLRLMTHSELVGFLWGAYCHVVSTVPAGEVMKALHAGGVSTGTPFAGMSSQQLEVVISALSNLMSNHE